MLGAPKGSVETVEKEFSEAVARESTSEG